MPVGGLRPVTVATVLGTVLGEGSITRGDIAAHTGLSVATVSRALDTLSADGLVREAEETGVGARGRPRMLVVPVPQGHMALGVDMGAANTRIVLMDLAGATLSYVREPTPNTLGPASLGRWLAGVSRAAMAGHEEAVRAVGLGLPGAVEPGTDRVSDAPNLPSVADPEFLAVYRGDMGLPVRADNDANMAVLGEYHFGAAHGVSTAVMVTIGAGLGAGVLIDGRILRGRSGAVGEFGSLPVGPLGRPLEHQITGPGILRRAYELGLDIDTPTQVFAPDAPAEVRKLRRGVIEALAIMLTAAALAYEPDIVVLSGGIAQSLAGSMSQVRDLVATHLHRAPRLSLSDLGDMSGSMGAAALALQLIYADLGMPSHLVRKLPPAPPPPTQPALPTQPASPTQPALPAIPGPEPAPASTPPTLAPST